MKQKLSIILSIILLICIPYTNVSANTDPNLSQNPLTLSNPEDVNTIVINEYDTIKYLQSKTDTELKAENFSNDEISELREFDYKKELLARAKLSEEQLKIMGYTDSQIINLKKLENTPEENISDDTVSLYAAVCTISSGQIAGNYYKYVPSLGSEYTTYGIEFYYKWSTFPFFTGTDIIVAQWDNGMYLDTGRSYLNATYVNLITNSSQGYNRYTFNTNFDGGMLSSNAQVKFSMSKEPAEVIYSPYGYGQIYCNKKARVEEFEMKFTYLHQQMSISRDPSISISGGGVSGAILLSDGLVAQDYSDHYYTITYRE